MDFLRNQLTNLKKINDNDNDNDRNGDGGDYSINGPTIGISPGQVKEDVHYMESSGDINLSYLRFYSDDMNYNDQHSLLDFSHHNNNRDNIEGIHDINNNNNDNGNGGGSVESFVDIVVFEVPEHCTSRNCDLSKVRTVITYF